jgi:exodeoxyribonuclease-3
MKIATWNVNSIRVRLPQLQQWLSENAIDILAIQETKTTDDKFPKAEIEAAGYQVIFSGQKSYNGVAILAKQNFQNILTDISQLQDPQRRILAAIVGDYRIINLYVPNGENVFSQKYSYKLDWLTKVGNFLKDQLQQYPKTVVLGDFNIAPTDQDVYDPVLWQDRVLCSQPERQAFQQLIDIGFNDSFRLVNQQSNEYSWWDYRAAAFRRNQGLRIDHILISNDLAPSCRECLIDKNPRKHQQPSDHAPVLVNLE